MSSGPKFTITRVQAVSTPPNLVWSNWKTKTSYPRAPTAYQASAHDIPVFRGAITVAPLWGSFEYQKALGQQNSYTQQMLEDFKDVDMADMFEAEDFTPFPTFPCLTNFCPNVSVNKGFECVECVDRANKLAQVCEQEKLAEFDYFAQF